MNTMPFNLVPISDERKRFHSNWLRERNLELELSKTVEDTQTLDCDYLLDDPSLLTQCDQIVSAGQIRLVDGELCEDPSEFRYVAIIHENEEAGSYLCVPFSRYSDPATKDEWRTPLQTTPLKVMQFWNTHEVPLIDLAQHSWTVCDMEPTVLSTAREIYAAVVSGAWLPLDLRNHTGTPIFRPDDVRLQYQSEEKAAFCKMDECMQDHIKALQQWRGWERDIAVESKLWQMPELLAASHSNRKSPIRIEYRSGKTWDGAVSQIESFADGDAYEIRWEIVSPPQSLRPGAAVLISSQSGERWQTITRNGGNLIILRLADQQTWRDLKSGKNKINMLAYVRD